MQNRRAQLVSEASEIPVGGSEDETKDKVKQLFKKDLGADKYKDMSKEDIAYLELAYEEDLKKDNK